MKCFPVQKLRKTFNDADRADVLEESERDDSNQESITPVASDSTSCRGGVRAVQNSQWFAHGNQKLRSSHPSYESRKDALERPESRLVLNRRARSATEARSAFFNLVGTCRHFDFAVPTNKRSMMAATAIPFTDDVNTSPPFLQPLPFPPQAVHLTHKVSHASSAYRLPLPSESACNRGPYLGLVTQISSETQSAHMHTTIPSRLVSTNSKTSPERLSTSSPSLLSACNPVQMADSSSLHVQTNQIQNPTDRISSPIPLQDFVMESNRPARELQTLSPPANKGILATTVLRCFKYDDVVSACQNFSLLSRLADSDNCFNGTVKVKESWESSKLQEVVVLRSKEWQQQDLQKWIMKLSTVAQECRASSHICQLLGFYGERRSAERMLVYERLEKGTLFSLLFGTLSNPPLNWPERMKIAYGAAQGLARLHKKFPNTVLYDDFQACSIQVDHDYNSKVSLYRVLDPVNLGPWTHSSNPRVNAYRAPETLSQGELRLESNVWSFGVMLLELLSGKQHTSEEIPKHNQLNLVKWAEPFLADEGKLFLLMDPKLQGNFPLRRAKKVASLVLQCLNMDPSQRPTMQEALYVVRDVRESRRSKLRERVYIQEASTSSSALPVFASLSNHQKESNTTATALLDIADRPVLRSFIVPPPYCGDAATHHAHDYPCKI